MQTGWADSPINGDSTFPLHSIITLFCFLWMHHIQFAYLLTIYSILPPIHWWFNPKLLNWFFIYFEGFIYYDDACFTNSFKSLYYNFSSNIESHIFFCLLWMIDDKGKCSIFLLHLISFPSFHIYMKNLFFIFFLLDAHKISI